jgi:hypothetical protein
LGLLQIFLGGIAEALHSPGLIARDTISLRIAASEFVLSAGIAFGGSRLEGWHLGRPRMRAPGQAANKHRRQCGANSRLCKRPHERIHGGEDCPWQAAGQVTIAQSLSEARQDSKN